MSTIKSCDRREFIYIPGGPVYTEKRIAHWRSNPEAPVRLPYGVASSFHTTQPPSPVDPAGRNGYLTSENVGEDKAARKMSWVSSKRKAGPEKSEVSNIFLPSGHKSFTEEVLCRGNSDSKNVSLGNKRESMDLEHR
ncbi:hypothetical protein C0Q70_04314 [Pomacea canaliculata]|uniref:Uncharacterized protein n=1 Tax=Pomacea canaliculata TaxID=400727 RepID=A0A2T7PV63_POMCA|nr:hypothetical protein C0Q70_04314 [Pomacea canaliculata]